MRMWMVDPKTMCRSHLLGEHVELHMVVGCLRKGNKVSGYVNKGLVELDKIIERHAQLVSEMESRGYNHNSPLKDFPKASGGKVNVEQNLIELARRCPFCRSRQQYNIVSGGK